MSVYLGTVGENNVTYGGHVELGISLIPFGGGGMGETKISHMGSTPRKLARHQGPEELSWLTVLCGCYTAPPVGSTLSAQLPQERGLVSP